METRFSTPPARRAAQLLTTLSLAATIVLSTACGSATGSTPTDERDPMAADFGPNLSSVIYNVPALIEMPGYRGVETNALMGRSVVIGDFDGNGQRDLAFGVPGRRGGRVVVRLNALGANSRDIAIGLHSLGLQGTTNDDFGWSLAVGNFNGDAYDDLAIGAPGRDLDGQDNAGEAFVLYGSQNGPSLNNYTRISQGQDGRREAGDRLGWSLAAGDFDGDGLADLAIGAPGEEYSGQPAAGAVLVRWGEAGGLGRRHAPTLLVHLEPQAHSQFGYALQAGRFQTAALVNGRGLDDLAIASPFRDATVYSVTAQRNILYSDTGEVMFFWGSRDVRYSLGNGPRLTDRLTDEPRFGQAMTAGKFNGGGLDQLAVGAPHRLNGIGYVAIVEPARNRVLSRLYEHAPDGLDEAGDDFGTALAAGDFNNDSYADLAIGAPNENWRGATDTGLVFIRFGSANGITTENAYFISQGNGVGARESGDRFGLALAAGDLSGDGAADLAIGAPYENITQDGLDFADAGAVFIARARAPLFGPFEGTWTGTVTGNNGSSAPVTLTLQDRNNVVGGTAAVGAGLIINVNEICAPRSDDDESPSGAQSLPIQALTTPANPRSLSTAGSITIQGYAVPYTLDLTVAAGGSTMTTRLVVDVPAICGSDRTFQPTLTKQ